MEKQHRTVILGLLSFLVCLPGLANSKGEAYLEAVRSKCQKHYFPLVEKSLVAGELEFTVQCDGSANNVLIRKSPHYKSADETALARECLKEAVMKSAPFGKPPADLGCPVTLKINFDNSWKAKITRLPSRASSEK